MGLEGEVGLSVVDPYRDARGWEFTGGEYTNNAEVFTRLAAAYEETDSGYDDRASTPVLWDTEREEIVSNESAVYKAGFSTNQDVYEREVEELFEMMDELDERLATRRYLFGDEPLETDWRVFPTLVRFDAVYNIHFKCSRRKLIEYEHLWPYARDLFQRDGIAETVRFDDIRRHYYTTHPDVNPSGLIAVMPDVDFGEPHGREGLGA